MPIPDDEKFENYLKQFRPVEPEGWNIEKHETRRSLPLIALWATPLGVALVLVLFMIGYRSKLHHFSEAPLALSKTEQVGTVELLTIQRANALLSQASSFEEAIEQLTHRPEMIQIEEGSQSALNVLSQEEIKQ